MRNILMTMIVGSAFLALPACDRDDVADEVKDLEQAKQNAPARVQELEKELEQSKAEVVSLEEALGRAREGVTDEVIEEREELQAALERQEKNVEQNVADAKKQAQSHNAESDKARAALESTTPPEVKAQVDTETEVTESERQPVRGTETEETIEIEQNFWEKEGDKPAEEAPTEEAKPVEETPTPSEEAKPVEE